MIDPISEAGFCGRIEDNMFDSSSDWRWVIDGNCRYCGKQIHQEIFYPRHRYEEGKIVDHPRLDDETIEKQMALRMVENHGRGCEQWRAAMLKRSRSRIVKVASA